MARALVRKPVILLLDEATSQLDVLTESQFDKHLIALSCARILIAHRGSTVRDAGFILVLNQGQLIERGTHEELFAQQGYCIELVRKQMEGAPSKGDADFGVPKRLSG